MVVSATILSMKKKHMLLFVLCCPAAEATMGCVGSKKEQEPMGKGTDDGDQQSHTLTTHYVKDPTVGIPGSKPVSSSGR